MGAEVSKILRLPLVYFRNQSFKLMTSTNTPVQSLLYISKANMFPW